MYRRFVLCALLKVALLAEGVDRNIASFGSIEWAKKSPSSRRAWIEIFQCSQSSLFGTKVALLAEGVDRNK